MATAAVRGKDPVAAAATAFHGCARPFPPGRRVMPRHIPAESVNDPPGRLTGACGKRRGPRSDADVRYSTNWRTAAPPSPSHVPELPAPGPLARGAPALGVRTEHRGTSYAARVRLSPAVVHAHRVAAPRRLPNDGSRDLDEERGLRTPPRLMTSRLDQSVAPAPRPPLSFECHSPPGGQRFSKGAPRPESGAPVRATPDAGAGGGRRWLAAGRGSDGPPCAARAIRPRDRTRAERFRAPPRGCLPSGRGPRSAHSGARPLIVPPAGVEPASGWRRDVCLRRRISARGRLTPPARTAWFIGGVRRWRPGAGRVPTVPPRRGSPRAWPRRGSGAAGCGDRRALRRLRYPPLRAEPSCHSQ